MATATYTKLRNGTWGIRSTTKLRDGQTVTVTKKSGETKTETVERVVWSGNGVWLAAIVQSDRPSRPATTHRNGARGGRVDCRRYGWDGVVGSPSYYTSGQYDEDS